MRINGYLWTSGVNVDTTIRFADHDFLIKVQNYRDLATFSVDFCIFIWWMSAILLLPVCLTYWPRNYTHASTTTSIFATKFEVVMTIHWRVIAFLSADTSRDFVTLTFVLLTLNSYHLWRVSWPTLRLFIFQLWIITFFIGYHWAYAAHCACAAQRGPWVLMKNDYIFGIPDPICPFTIQLLLGFDDD